MSPLKVKPNQRPFMMVYDADEEELKEKKYRSHSSLVTGMGCYHIRRWKEGIEHLRKTLSIYPEDVVAQQFLQMCETYLADPPEEDWSSTLVLTQK